jgi:hypothetical protein
MKTLLCVLCLVTIVSCGKNGKNGKNGVDGLNGTSMDAYFASAVSNGIDFRDIEPGLACANGGLQLITFKDRNTDGELQDEEAIIRIKSICNGTNGTNGSNASMSVDSFASSSTCPNGGVKISSSSSYPVEVCNGADGLNGEQGVPGVQGLPGLAGPMGPQGPQGAAGAAGQNGTNGKDGSSITPVKFCVDDQSKHPEYGLMIGSDLFAVYWGTTPASPSVPQAFLTKLIAGNYQSTGGNNCLFSIK